MDCDGSPVPYTTATRDPRAEAFARLFEAVHEGVYIGSISRDEHRHAGSQSPPQIDVRLRDGDAPKADVRPFDPARFVDPRARDAFLERLATDGSVSDHLLRLRRADDSSVWVEVTARADAGTRSGRLRVEALVRDVSERKKLDDQTRDLYHQLLQAEKLAALGQTISGVAHELNNPLATILTLGRAARRSARGRRDHAARPRDDPQRVGARRADRAQPAHLRAQAADARARWWI